MIKAVFFDVDNTLYDFERVRNYGLSIALQHLYERLPNTRGRLTLQHLIQLREQVAEETEGSRLDLIEIRTESFRRALATCGYGDDLAPALTRIYTAHRFSAARPFDGARAALRALQGRYALGVISNANTPLECLGLEDYFEHRLYAEEVGLVKPDPRIFEMAMNRVPCRAEEFLFVGDSVEFDVMGAMNAGARSAWFNPQGTPYPDGLARPDFEITDLSELVGIVERLE
jgi:putative hydrolase of the HAD superfamily